MTDSNLLAQVEQYLSFRRGLGFDLETAACHLRSFARYAEQVGHRGPITVDLATRWALRSRSGEPAQAVRRLAVIRLFARHRALIDPATEIPPVDLLGRVPRRKAPHIYSDAEIRSLLQQAGRMRPRGGLCPKTYVAFFALLFATGLRLSEACRLARGDVDLDRGLLTIRGTKFRKSRCVPLHPSTTRALTQYAAEHDAIVPSDPSSFFFRTQRVPKLTPDTVQKAFGCIRRRLGWTAQGRARRPRIHDTRHTFAVRRLLHWYEELVAERGVSAHTIASYRDSFELLLRYAEQRTGRTASALTPQDLDAPMILSFLDHLETERGCGARTRNLRLTAVRSFMRYASVRDPTSLPIAQRVLAIAGKRFDRPVLEFLSRDEMQALLDAPDRTTWSGQRDAALIAVLYNTGARVSEIIRLRVADVLLDRAHAVHLHGKGRKERVIPLWKSTVAQLRTWFERIDRQPEASVFPNRVGKPMSRSGVEQRLRVTIAKASVQCPSLRGRPISPHSVRHATAMHLLQAGVDITVIAMWLGHEDTSTTHQYIEADLEMKEAALKRLDAPSSKPVRFKANDRLLAFLEAL